MNMKKLLATGLIATVAMASTEASAGASICGGYIGVNAGVTISKTKVKTEQNDYVVGHYGNAFIDGVNIADNAAANATARATANELSAYIANSHKINPRKTGSTVELVLGFDLKRNRLAVGADAIFGYNFGVIHLKSKELDESDIVEGHRGYNPSRKFAKLQKQWHFALMPRIGFLIKSRFEGYVTFGVKLQHLKYETYRHGDAYLNGSDAGADRDAQDTNELLDNSYNMKVERSTTRCIPVIGAGLRFDIKQNWFAKLEYNYEFESKPKLPEKGIVEVKKVKVQTHVIKLGMGCRF